MSPQQRAEGYVGSEVVLCLLFELSKASVCNYILTAIAEKLLQILGGLSRRVLIWCNLSALLDGRCVS